MVKAVHPHYDETNCGPRAGYVEKRFTFEHALKMLTYIEDRQVLAKVIELVTQPEILSISTNSWMLDKAAISVKFDSDIPALRDLSLDDFPNTGMQSHLTHYVSKKYPVEACCYFKLDLGYTVCEIVHADDSTRIRSRIEGDMKEAGLRCVVTKLKLHTDFRSALDDHMILYAYEKEHLPWSKVQEVALRVGPASCIFKAKVKLLEYHLAEVHETYEAQDGDYLRSHVDVAV